MCLVEEEKIWSSPEKDSWTYDDALEIDEDEGGLHYSKDDHDEREDWIDNERHPKEFEADTANIFFIGSTLKHEFFSSKLIVLEEPPDSCQFLACDVLGEPKVNNDHNSYKLIDD